MKKLSLSGIRCRQLKTTDITTAVYLLATAVIILSYYPQLQRPWLHLAIRSGVFLLMAIFVFLHLKKRQKIVEFVHLFYPLILLVFLFRETAYMNHLFFHQDFDGWLVRVEEELFGFLPAVAFSKYFPQAWLSELLNFGYFSFYFMIFGITLAFYFKYPGETERVVFIIITAFFIYYLFFIFFPTEGPVYFLPAPLNGRVQSGIFSYWVALAEKLGDGPTGAFPSSHVGMSVIYVMLTYRRFPKLFWLICFLALLICFATVYIKAHYFLDVVGGLLSAPLVYGMSNWLYKKALSLKKRIC